VALQRHHRRENDASIKSGESSAVASGGADIKVASIVIGISDSASKTEIGAGYSETAK
jgi:hypothetical protein